MMKLVLIRHGESEWNKLNLFTGWTDVELSEKGWGEAKAAGKLLRDEGYDFDICYTSLLKRAIHTAQCLLAEMDLDWIPMQKYWQLNERHYGALQGLNKSETAEKYGQDQVTLWRRSYDVCPPALSAEDERNPIHQRQYAGTPAEGHPLTESLEITVNRVVPFYEQVLVPQIKAGKRLLVAAHGNSLRALVKYLDGLTPEEIVSVNIPTGVPLVYEFDDDMNVVGKYYLGDQEAIAAKAKAVSEQANKKG